MAVKIDEEAKLRTRLRVDIDKHRYIYQTFEVDSDSDTSVLINFVSPSIFVYENYRFFLLKNSVIKEFNPQHRFRPDYLSYEEYGTTILWTMILYINDIPNIEEFTDIENLYIPKISAIYRIADDVLIGQKIDVTPKISLSNKVYSSIYTKKSRPTLIEQDSFVAEPVTEDFYYLRQTYTVTTAIAARQYVDLNEDTAYQSISFKIQGKSSFVYDQDYVLVNDDNGKPKRISWERRQVLGDGLLDVIEEGMVLEIQYAKKL